MNVGRYLRGEDRHVGTTRTKSQQAPKEKCRVCGSSGQVEQYTSAAAPHAKVPCPFCKGGLSGSWCPTPEGCGPHGCHGACLPKDSDAQMEPQPDSRGQAREGFQRRVEPWLLACFGEEIAADRTERSHRFIEEALELVQACGTTASEAHQLVDYVYGRPVGEAHQEVGGVMVTLAALCRAHALDMHEAGETELARIWTKVEQIRAKQAAKPKHSPLPAAASPTPDEQRAQAAQEDVEATVERLMGLHHEAADAYLFAATGTIEWVADNARRTKAADALESALRTALAGKGQDVSHAAHDVLAERRRHVEVEGWTPEHDDEHGDGEMAVAAACYARWASDAKRLPNWVPPEWPWADEWWKPGEPRRMLEKAGALILAEIERLDRAALAGRQR